MNGPRLGVGATVLGAALVIVVAMIAIGVARIVGDGPEASADPSAVPSVIEAVEPVTSVSAGPAPVAISASPEPIPPAFADIALVDLDGGGERFLSASFGTFEGLTGWQSSPDGRSLAFSHGGRLYVASIGGERVVPVTPSIGANSPAWSSDGRHLVFTTGADIQLVQIRSGHITSLVRGVESIFRPTFGPGGRTILFTAPKGLRLWLWEVPVSGGVARPLFQGAFGVYSPDGDVIAFRTTGYDGDDLTEMTSSGLLVADPDGSVVQHVPGRIGSMSQVNPLALWPSWSPDGTMLAYQPLYGRPVWIVDATTGRRVDTVLVNGPYRNPAPAWLDGDTLIIGWEPAR